MAQDQIRLPASQRNVTVKSQGVGRLSSDACRPGFKRGVTKSALMAAAAIKAAKAKSAKEAKARRLFRRPSLEMVKDVAQVAVFNLLGPDLPSWSEDVELELVDKLKSALDEHVGGPYLRQRAVRELLMQSASRCLGRMEPLMPFQPASERVVKRIVKVVAKRRRSVSGFVDFSACFRAYCEACCGYTGISAARTYMFIHLQRCMEKLKGGRYIRMATLRGMLEDWAEEEIGRIEKLLVQVAYGRGGGRKLSKRESPNGHTTFMLTLRFERTKVCFLVVKEMAKGKRRILALKTSKDFKRNIRKRFNRNARNSYANLPARLRH